MEKSKLQSAIEETGHEARSYSGRGMYGKTCLGVDIPRGVGFFEVIADILTYGNLDEEELGDFASALRSAKTDSMGLGSILYFEGVEYVDEDEGACPHCGSHEGEGATDECPGCGEPVSAPQP